MAGDKAGEVSSILVTRAFNIRQKSLCLLLKSMGTTDDFSVDLYFVVYPHPQLDLMFLRAENSFLLPQCTTVPAEG